VAVCWKNVNGRGMEIQISNETTEENQQQTELSKEL
jgi:hypothetical protein